MKRKAESILLHILLQTTRVDGKQDGGQRTLSFSSLTRQCIIRMYYMQLNMKLCQMKNACVRNWQIWPKNYVCQLSVFVALSGSQTMPRTFRQTLWKRPQNWDFSLDHSSISRKSLSADVSCVPNREPRVMHAYNAINMYAELIQSTGKFCVKVVCNLIDD